MTPFFIAPSGIVTATPAITTKLHSYFTGLNSKTVIFSNPEFCRLPKMTGLIKWDSYYTTIEPALNGHKNSMTIGRKRQVALQQRGKINIKSKELHKRLTSQSGFTRQLATQSSDRK